MPDKGDGTPVPREPIALIGIGCRFPGANGPEGFWRLLREGVDAIREVPADRFDIDAVYDPRPGTPGKMGCHGSSRSTPTVDTNGVIPPHPGA